MLITYNVTSVILVCIIVLINSVLVYGKGGRGGGNSGGGKGGGGKGGGGKHHGHGYGSSGRYTYTSNHLILLHSGYGVRTSSEDVVCRSKDSFSASYCSHNEQCCGQSNTQCCSRTKSNDTLIAWIVGITGIALFAAFAYEICRCITEDDEESRSDSLSNVSLAEVCPSGQTRPGVINPMAVNSQPSVSPLYIPLHPIGDSNNGLHSETTVPPYQNQTPPPSYPSVVPGSPQPTKNSCIETPPPAYGMVIPSIVQQGTPTLMMPDTFTPSAPPIVPQQSATPSAPPP